MVNVSYEASYKVKMVLLFSNFTQTDLRKALWGQEHSNIFLLGTEIPTVYTLEN